MPGVPVEREQGSRFDDGRRTYDLNCVDSADVFPEHRHLGSALWFSAY